MIIARGFEYEFDGATYCVFKPNNSEIPEGRWVIVAGFSGGEPVYYIQHSLDEFNLIGPLAVESYDEAMDHGEWFHETYRCVGELIGTSKAL